MADTKNVSALEVYAIFESSFRDKEIIPDELKLIWLKRAIARYSIELDDIEFDEENLEFTSELNKYAVVTLAGFMKQFYQEREVSKVDKRVSIVTKDVSIDGNGNSKTASRLELEYCAAENEYMIANQMPTAYT